MGRITGIFKPWPDAFCRSESISAVYCLGWGHISLCVRLLHCVQDSSFSKRTINGASNNIVNLKLAVIKQMQTLFYPRTTSLDELQLHFLTYDSTASRGPTSYPSQLLPFSQLYLHLQFTPYNSESNGGNPVHECISFY